MLRCFVSLSAQACAHDFITEILENNDTNDAVTPTTLAVVRTLYTCFQDCNDLVCDTPTVLGKSKATLLTTLKREEEAVSENGEMYSYIEKAMSVRVRILPFELRPTMKDALGSLLRMFAKEVLEEVRTNVLFDYQLHNLIINLAFVFSMAGALLDDLTEVKPLFDEVLCSAYERCYEPSSLPDSKQRKAIVDGIITFMKQK